MIDQESAKTDRESEKSHKYLNKNKGVPSLLDSQLPERSEDHELIKKVMGPLDPQPADLNDIRSDDYFTKHAKNQNQLFGNPSKGPIRIETQDEQTQNSN